MSALWIHLFWYVYQSKRLHFNRTFAREIESSRSWRGFCFLRHSQFIGSDTCCSRFNLCASNRLEGFWTCRVFFCEHHSILSLSRAWFFPFFFLSRNVSKVIVKMIDYCEFSESELNAENQRDWNHINTQIKEIIVQDIISIKIFKQQWIDRRACL